MMNIMTNIYNILINTEHYDQHIENYDEHIQHSDYFLTGTLFLHCVPSSMSHIRAVPAGGLWHSGVLKASYDWKGSSSSQT